MSSAWPEEMQRPFRRYLSKVPEVTVLFWIIKILASTAGGPVADLLSSTLDLGLGITTMLVTTVLAVVLVVQVAAVRYVPWLYWLAVVLISIFGALVADNLVDILAVPLAAAAIALAVLLAGTFAVWRAVERTLSIHTIDTPSREAFYWLAAALTFALGTAAAGLGTGALGLGYGTVAVTCAVLIAAVAAGHRFLGLSGPVAFWIAYVLTQPLGVSLGDLLAQPADAGGRGLGVATTGAAVLAAIVAAVAWLSITHRDQPSLDNATRRIHT
jgi:uncharacterized membrane-anchored protein